MTTQKPQFTVVLDQELFDALEDFRFNNRYSSRSKALNIILRAGMDALKATHPELDLSKRIELQKKDRNNKLRP